MQLCVTLLYNLGRNLVLCDKKSLNLKIKYSGNNRWDKTEAWTGAYDNVG